MRSPLARIALILTASRLQYFDKTDGAKILNLNEASLEVEKQ